MTQADLDFLTRRAELRAAQRLGIAPPPGQISERELARHLGLSRHAIARLKATALAKILAGLGERGVPVHDLRAMRSLLSNR
jgi:hypothetical protein